MAAPMTISQSDFVMCRSPDSTAQEPVVPLSQHDGFSKFGFSELATSRIIDKIARNVPGGPWS